MPWQANVVRDIDLYTVEKLTCYILNMSLALMGVDYVDYCSQIDVKCSLWICSMHNAVFLIGVM